MDVVESENVKVSNSVIVRGLTETEMDEELTEFLIKYGRIARTIRIDNPRSQYHKHVIVEYESGSAVCTLSPVLPYTFESPSHVTYEIRALSAEYLPVAARSATDGFMSELQRLSKITGKSFEEILKDQLSICETSATAGAGQPENPCNAQTQSESDPQSQADPQVFPQVAPAGVVTPEPVSTTGKDPNSFSFNTREGVQEKTAGFVNPPEVQRMIVEHIVRNETSATQSVSFKIRSFSGRVPCPSHETDFESWRTSVELILQDSSFSDLQRSRKILDSLLSPAADIVKHLGPQASPLAYLELLESAFGVVEDGDELFAKFLNTLQNHGEKPSHYLQRLQTVITKVQKQGGILPSEADRHLLRQFCRGCWNDALIADLQLERKRNNPPSFSELLLQLRTEEDRHVAKENRMRKHLGTSRQKVSSNFVSASSVAQDTSVEVDISEMKKQVSDLQSRFTKLETPRHQRELSPQESSVAELKKQVTDLKNQLINLTSQTEKKAKAAKASVKTPIKPKPSEKNSVTSQASSVRPKPWYCFQCGEDGHIASTCSNNPNPALVAAKKKQLREKQSVWDSQHGQDCTLTLN
ncbi:zinc finger CCHC domain-containing protein 18-like [Oryzias latipes]|uniref:zinc finger CCHC domain-containing protein 18-like n=1 Tax=Oryzias latipes TaxID=8090 RepID=UPI000CE28609|nr:zinc finger CCHC domain-containing protein 18-like [Oryzias latipes]